MAFEQLTERLNEIAKKLDEAVPEVALVQSFVELQADFLSRVFEQGLNSQNEKIGEYDDSPAYFSKDEFINKGAFRPQGKDPDNENKATTQFIRVSNIATKKTRKLAIKKDFSERLSMYLPKGYKEFRDIQGRPTAYVNLKFSGSLERAYRVFKFGDSVLFGQNDTEEHKKIEGLTDRFGEWQSLTQEEVERLKESIPEQIAIILGNDNQTTT
jgi:hypothetical protein